jgi:hypothetical protein
MKSTWCTHLVLKLEDQDQTQDEDDAKSPSDT